jgi:hypothetical protein
VGNLAFGSGGMFSVDEWRTNRPFVKNQYVPARRLLSENLSPSPQHALTLNFPCRVNTAARPPWIDLAHVFPDSVWIRRTTVCEPDFVAGVT